MYKINKTYTISINNYTIVIKFYVFKKWINAVKYYSDVNVKCLYLPMLDISINNNNN